jgi:hypothetical protein
LIYNFKNAALDGGLDASKIDEPSVSFIEFGKSTIILLNCVSYRWCYFMRVLAGTSMRILTRFLPTTHFLLHVVLHTFLGEKMKNGEVAFVEFLAPYGEKAYVPSRPASKGSPLPNLLELERGTPP